MSNCGQYILSGNITQKVTIKEALWHKSIKYYTIGTFFCLVRHKSKNIKVEHTLIDLLS